MKQCFNRDCPFYLAANDAVSGECECAELCPGFISEPYNISYSTRTATSDES